MREIRSYGSVGERGGNEPLYPEIVELPNCRIVKGLGRRVGKRPI